MKWQRKFLPRLWSNDVLRELCPRISGKPVVINVSAWRDEDREGAHYSDYFPTKAKYDITNHPDDSERGGAQGTGIALDLSKPLPEHLRGQYDVALSHTVLEHVPDPSFSFAQIAALSRDLVITVIPFYQKMHFSPGNYGDYTRLSPLGLRRLNEQNGLTTVFEAYTPSPALDVYIISVGARKPGAHPDLPQKILKDTELNNRVGSLGSLALVQNLVYRLLQRTPLAVTLSPKSAKKGVKQSS